MSNNGFFHWARDWMIGRGKSERFKMLHWNGCNISKVLLKFLPSNFQLRQFSFCKTYRSFHYHKCLPRLHKPLRPCSLLSVVECQKRTSITVRSDAKCHESLNQNLRSREPRVAVVCSYLRSDLSVQKLIKWKPRRIFALRGQIKNSSISFRTSSIQTELKKVRVYWIALTKLSANH